LVSWVVGNFLKVDLINNDPIVGARIKDRIVTFSRTSEVLDRPFTLSVSCSEMVKILITDVREGTWQIQIDGKVRVPAVIVSAKDQTIYFEAEPGDYTFLR
jgi:heparin/heparan-sulfate lyase